MPALSRVTTGRPTVATKSWSRLGGHSYCVPPRPCSRMRGRLGRAMASVELIT